MDDRWVYMKLMQIEIVGFGKLVNKKFDFHPKLNLVYGVNEAGKSTLQRSILSGLFGFFDDGTISSQKRSLLTAYEPWESKANYGVKLIFEVDDGKKYEVSRLFSPKPETNIYDYKNKKNLNSIFRSSSQGRLFFAEELLGMSREVFENTCLVRQAELISLEKSASAITDTLLKISASASQETTSTQALEILENTLKEQVGTQRSRNKPLPEAQKMLEKLRTIKSNLISDNQMLSNNIRELNQIEEKYNALVREREKAEFQKLRAHHHSILQQKNDLSKTSTEVKSYQQDLELYKSWSSISGEIKRKLQKLLPQYEKAQDDFFQNSKRISNTFQLLSELQSQIQMLLSSINENETIEILPKVEDKSSIESSNLIISWIDRSIQIIENEIIKLKDKKDSKSHELTVLSSIGHENIFNDRQKLINFETEMNNALLAIQEIESLAKKERLPIEEWENILDRGKGEMEKWEKWKDFPIFLYDDLHQLRKQYDELKQKINDKFTAQKKLQNDLRQYKDQEKSITENINKLVHTREIPHQQKLRVEEILRLLEEAEVNFVDSHKKLNEINESYLAKKRNLEIQVENKKELFQLGSSGLSSYHQNWLSLHNRINTIDTLMDQSQESLPKGGISNEEKVELSINGEILGKKSHKGIKGFLIRIWDFIRSIFRKKQKTKNKKTIAIDSQISDIDRLKTEKSNKIIEIHKLEDELKVQLGDLIPEKIEGVIFSELTQSLKEAEKIEIDLEKEKELLDLQNSFLNQKRNNAIELETRLENEIGQFNFPGQDIKERVRSFIKACEDKEKLIELEHDLERLQSRIALIEPQLEQLQSDKVSLDKVVSEVLKILRIANLNPDTETLDKQFDAFEEYSQYHRNFVSASIDYEMNKREIDEIRKKMDKQKSLLSLKQNEFTGFKHQLIKKYKGLLPSEIKVLHFDQLEKEYKSLVDESAHYETSLGKLERLKLEGKSVKSDLESWAQSERIKCQFENDIFDSIKSLGIDTNNLSLTEAITKYEDALDQNSKYEKAKHSLETAFKAEESVRKNVPKLDSEINRLELKISEIIKGHPSWESIAINEKEDYYEQKIEKLDVEIIQERDRLTRLKDVVSQGKKSLRPLAEIEEEIALASAEFDQLSFFGQSLEIASMVLENSTNEYQKLFAPRLERLVASGISHISNKRYNEVKIDPSSLNVLVIAPEKNEIVHTQQLSTGTRDLIYLILRVGIAQMMSNSGEKLPLLLDDPFVEFDYFRQKAALEYVTELSQKTQIFIFTKDREILSWYKSKKDKQEIKIIELI